MLGQLEIFRRVFPLIGHTIKNPAGMEIRGSWKLGVQTPVPQAREVPVHTSPQGTCKLASPRMDLPKGARTSATPPRELNLDDGFVLPLR